MKDATLVELAASEPADRAALSRVSGLSPRTARRAGETLLRILQAARGESPGKESARPPEPSKAALRAMQAVVAKVAADLGIEPEVLASKKDLLALLTGSSSTRVLTGWRREAVGQALLPLAEAASS